VQYNRYDVNVRMMNAYAAEQPSSPEAAMLPS
jgi:hypothetical protein